MDGRQIPAPVLIFTYGNPSRGDDALGPALYDQLVKHKQVTGDLADVDLLTDFQLQVEHALDLEHRQYILFVDAGVACAEPFEVRRLQAERDDSFTTHAMSPAAILAVYRQINQCDPPPAWLLTIRAYGFGLGLSISECAMENLRAAYQYVIAGRWMQDGAIPDSIQIDPEQIGQNKL